MKFFISLFLFSCFLVSCKDDKDGGARLAKSDSAFTVTSIVSPAKDSCGEPFLFTGKQDLVYFSWIEKISGMHYLRFSTLENDQWSDPITIASGDKWFVNWADYPVMMSDGNNNLTAHYLQKSSTGTYSYDINYLTSSDKGKSWKNRGLLNDDGLPAEHGFVSMSPFADKVFVSWLDGRETAKDNMPDAKATVKAEHKEHHGQMTLRGAILDHNGNKEKEWQLDGRVCDCCQTSAAVTDNGPVVVYRDRSPEEIRDLAIVRFVNGQWTAPSIIFPDHWEIDGCPVNGPRIDASGNVLGIAWFTMKDNQGEVKVIFSGDGGATFGNPIRVNDHKSIGRVDIVMLDSTTAMVSWMEGAVIKAAKVYSKGIKEQSVIIGQSSESRAGGFPQMTKSGENIVFAWTDDKTRSIKTARLKIR